MIATKVFQLDTGKRRRPGFTLVELLVVITIIGIMAGMLMYTLAGAQQDAKSARTRGTIKKINDIILARWEEFRYRSVKINLPENFLVPYQDSLGEWHVPISPREGARARLIVLRDVMRMELPDRYSDILYTPTKYRIAARTSDTDSTNDVLVEPVDREVPGVYQMYRRKMVVQPDPLSTINPWPGTAAYGVAKVGVLRPTIQNQSAELLYQIVSSSNYNGSSALEYFRPTEIGDTDGDGFSEFLDAWGNPIRWLRWPSGIASPLNDTLVPDAMDPLKTDWRWSGQQKPWLLVPLVVSAGADGQFDIAFDFDPNNSNLPCVDPSGAVDSGLVTYATNQWNGAPQVYTNSGPYYYPDPYLTLSGVALGQTVDLDGDGVDGSTDNISNYELLLQ